MVAMAVSIFWAVLLTLFLGYLFSLSWVTVAVIIAVTVAVLRSIEPKADQEPGDYVPFS